MVNYLASIRGIRIQGSWNGVGEDQIFPRQKARNMCTEPLSHLYT